MLRPFSLLTALVVLLTVGPGCTKLVLLEEPTFDARRAVVITFQDGSQIRGKVGLDEKVELTTGGAVYRGMVADVTEDEIVLERCYFVCQADDFTAGRERMIKARVDLGVELVDFVFQREQIARVELIKVDAMRTATQAGFWTLSGAVSALLLSERS